MIPNIVVPIPTPIYGGGNANPKIIAAFCIVIAVVSILLIVGGIVYDGIKHNKWTMRTDPDVPDKLGYMNFAKMSGYLTLFFEITITVLVWLIISISELL